MGNLVYLSQDADPKTRGRIADRLCDCQAPRLLDNIDDCIVKIVRLRDQVRQALDTARMALDNLDDVIASLPDSEHRLMLERQRQQAREVVLVNSRTISHALEFMTATACKVRGDVACLVTESAC